jgi:cobalt-zinc-cadmium efflux system outer membrane protein
VLPFAEAVYEPTAFTLEKWVYPSRFLFQNTTLFSHMPSQHRLTFIGHLKTPLMVSMMTLLTLSTASLHAQESLIISLDSIEDRIQKQNPDLAAARKRIAEAKGRLDQSGRLSNPVFGVEASQDPSFEERALRVSIAQKFPVTNRLALAKAVSQTSMKAAEAEVLDVERRLSATAKQLVIHILANQKQRQLLKKQQALAHQFATHLSESADKGEGSVLDAGQAKLEAAQFTNQLRQLSARSASLHGLLKPLLGMSITELLSVTGNLSGFHLPSSSPHTNQRPDLKAAKLHAAAATQSAALERAKSRDDIEVTFTAGVERTEDVPVGYDSEKHFGIGFRIPLPLWNNNKGAIDEADARSERKHLEASALDHKIQHQASTAYTEMSEWAKIGREISLNLLPMARKQAELAVNAYHEGQGDLQATLRAREQVLDLSSAELEALRDFHLAKARYRASLNQ